MTRPPHAEAAGTRSLLDELPDEVRPVRTLARRADEAVAVATRDGATVVVRCLARPRGAALREWEVLRDIESPLVAKVMAWGSLGGGGLWVAREWIEGQALEAFARRATQQQLARIAVDVLRSLADVHATGIVHGDISPGNIVVDREGRGRLTDFGLAASAHDDTRGRRSGTPMFIAPEVLVGASASPAADLFGVGAVLALALAPVTIDPARFYGRFPAEPFLTAAGIDADALPSWSRLLLARLLSRDPAARGSSPVALADQIEADLDGVALARPRRSPRGPRIDALAGRGPFLAAVRELRPGLSCATTVDDDEARDVIDALAIALMREGAHVGLVEIDRLARSSSHTLELDRRVAAVLRSVRRTGERAGLVVVLVDADDDWACASLDALGHAALADGRCATLAILGRSRSRAIVRPESPWRRGEQVELSELPRAVVMDTLRAGIHGTGQSHAESIEAFADRVDLLAGGSSAAANQLLQRAEQLGAYEWAPEGASAEVQLASAFSPAGLAAESGASLPDATPDDARILLAALAVVGGNASRHELEGMVASPGFEGALSWLRSAGLVDSATDGRLRSRAARIPLSALGLPRERIRSMHARALDRAAPRAASPRSGDEAPLETWVHLLGSARGPSDSDPEVATVLTACRRLERQGLRARIARGLVASRACLESELRALPPALMRELALALARSGQARRAREVASLTSGAATAQEVEGILAHVEGDREAAATAFEAAGRPLQARLERAQGAVERGDLSDFDQHVSEDGLASDPEDTGDAVARADLLALAALVAQRRGAIEDAWALLDRALRIALECDAPLSEGAVRVNRAVLANATGQVDRALDELDAARSLFQSLGYAAGEAQVQALLGSTQKARGELLEAEQPLRTALERRQRLGQHRAAGTTRGTLGLLMLERGHLRSAADELDRAARALERGEQAENVALIEAALDLALARLGEMPPRPATVSGAVGSRDPRVAEWHARAAWIRGDAARASEWLDASPAGGSAHPQASLRSALAKPLTPVLEDESRITDAGRPAAECLAIAEHLRGKGHDARAARFAIEAVVRARRAGEQDLERRAMELARAALATAHVGLTAPQAVAAEMTLLGRPDPRPESLRSWRDGEDEDMDVMTILELNERLVRQEDTRTLLGAIVEAALEVSGAERGFLVLSRDGEFELDTAFDSSRGEIEDEDLEYSRSIIEQVLETKASLRVGDALEHPEWGAARSIEELHLRSILAAPFFVSPRLAGVVVVDDRRRPGAFGPREQRLLELLGGQAALAIRQVQRLEENRSLAAELRRRVETQGEQLQAAQRALDEASVVAPIEGLIGESEAMQRVRAMIHRVARATISTLITGPSGSGKEVAARAIHALSPRSEAPFISENCAALPPSLVEAELFGAAKGSYTGADADRVGLFERASGGTLFLDEIGELPLEAQAKLLRVLETRTIRRIGEEVERPVDFRLVSATNRDLAREAEAGAFRSDLMYRLDGVTIPMPAIAERVEDVPALVRHLLILHSETDGAPRTMAPEVLQRLMDRPWPGNVRELSNEVRRLCVLSDGDIVDPELVRPAASHGLAAAPAGGGSAGGVRTIAELERAAIFDALEATGGDKRRAAELLGISRAKIYQRLKEWSP